MLCYLWFFIVTLRFFFYPHAVGVFISWLNTCSNSWTQLPQTRSLCWVIFGGEGSAEEVGRAFRPLWAENRFYPVDYCCLVPLTLPTPQSQSWKSRRCDAVASFLQSWTESLLISWKGGTVCELCELLHPFFPFTGALVCVVLGGRGVVQTKQKTDFPPQWCHCRKLKKQRLFGLDFLGSGGGGHQESLPTWPPTSEIKEAKMGTKRTEKKTILYGSTKIKLIPTSMEDKLFREEAKKKREQRWYLLGLFFFFFVQAC